MKIEEIRELKEMGFTADQIMTLSGQPAGAPAEAQAAQDESPAEAQDESPAETPAEAPDNCRIQKLEQTISDQQKQIKDLVKQMQANNRRTASMNTPPDQDLQTKTDEIMAELIRPSIKKGE